MCLHSYITDKKALNVERKKWDAAVESKKAK